ncbi:Suppressor of gene silencing protein [Thalictrum thalictroides]|uniref:Suppressor of gene silencing protein n=1 Tax=Thalictrum thalictroides TaxID=46969 RepID=A0A7J6WJJ3_THATH|nr:Suppressor of gene silencing protein [Thalictrum thalictroides]
MAHAKTKGSSRVKLHRDLAELLDVELNRKGTSIIPASETFGKWEGLCEAEHSRKIIWPPIIVVMNTQAEMDENDEKWLGIGNQELLDYFDSYRAIKARSSYGPKGHRGMSILIFESSPAGYMEADSLHIHLADQGTGRHAWEKKKILFRPGGKRQLYGYMAHKEDLDIFDKHSQDKTKFEIRSYQEMVLMPMRQMREDNHELVWLKNTNAKLTKQSKTLEESLALVSKKWRKTMEENRIVRQRTKLQHDQNKEEMDYQEQFFKDQFDTMQQVLEKSNQEISVVARSQEDSKLRREEIAEFIPSQAKDNKEFEAERGKLVKLHEDKKSEMRCRHTEEETDLEKEFESSLTRIIEKYALRSS